MLVIAPSSLQYWQRFRLGRMPHVPGLSPFDVRPASHQVRLARLTTCVDVPSGIETQDHLGQALLGIEPPVHLAVTDPNARRSSSLRRCHLMAAPLPSGGFMRLRPGLYMATPELTVVAMATALSRTELLALIHCLCGRFVPVAGEGMRKAPPVTRVDAIASFVRRNPGLRGGSATLRALRLAHDRCASPMEVALLLLACLPCRHGGFGLPFPLVNERIVPSREYAGKLGQGWYECDMLWPKAHVVMEYDGEEGHAGADKMAHDAARRNDLRHLGNTVFVITKRQLYSEPGLERAMAQVSRAIGFKPRHRQMGLEWNLQHARLRQELLFRDEDVGAVRFD